MKRRDDTGGLFTPNRLRSDGLELPPQNRKRAVVFDRRRNQSTNPEVRAGLLSHTAVSFRTTDRDKLPAREVVTARLLGDPAPGRPMLPEPAVERERICTESGPVLLTFGEYRRHYGEDVR